MKKKKIILSILIAIIIVGIGIIIALAINKEKDNKVLTELITDIKYPESVDSNCLEKGSVCNYDEIIKGILVSVSVNKNDTKNFYVIDNDENSLTLLSENNVVEKSEWYFQLANTFGPNSLLINLSEATKNWTNIDPIDSYSYQDAGYTYYRNICINNSVTEEKYNCDNGMGGAGYVQLNIENGDIRVNTISGSKFIFEGQKVRARVITKEEVEKIIGGAQEQIPWLKDTEAFWTLTSATERVNSYYTKAYAVQKSEKHLSGVALYPYNVTFADGVGIRAIIKIEK